MSKTKFFWSCVILLAFWAIFIEPITMAFAFLARTLEAVL